MLFFGLGVDIHSYKVLYLKSEGKFLREAESIRLVLGHVGHFQNVDKDFFWLLRTRLSSKQFVRDQCYETNIFLIIKKTNDIDTSYL